MNILPHEVLSSDNRPPRVRRQTAQGGLAYVWDRTPSSDASRMDLGLRCKPPEGAKLNVLVCAPVTLDVGRGPGEASPCESAGGEVFPIMISRHARGAGLI